MHANARRVVDVLAAAGLQADVALGCAAVTRADADLVRAATGFPIGGVPPVAHPTPLRTLIDSHLASFDVVWAAAGTPNAVFATTYADLERVTAAAAADVAAR